MFLKIEDMQFAEQEMPNGNIAGKGGYGLYVNYMISKEDVDRDLRERQTEHCQRRGLDQLNHDLEKKFIEHIQGNAKYTKGPHINVFVSKHATGRTLVVPPLDYHELLKPGRGELKFSMPNPLGLTMNIPADGLSISWVEFNVPNKLLDEIFEAINYIYYNGYMNDKIKVLIPPKKMMEYNVGNKNLETTLKNFIGTELFSFANFKAYVHDGIDKIVAIGDY